LLLLAVCTCWPLWAAEQELRKAETRSWLGVWLGNAVDGGVQVVAIAPEGPADKAGLRSGDIILRANEAEVSDQDVLSKVMSALGPGDQLELGVLRSGMTLDLPVELGSWEFRVSAPVSAAPDRAAATIKLNIPRDYRLESFLPAHALGVQVAEITPMLRQHYGAPGDAGVLIVRIDPDQPGDKAGLAVGDILVRIDGQVIADRGELEERLLTWQGEHPLQLQIIRESEPRAVSVTTKTLVERPRPPLPDEAPAPPSKDMALVQKRIEAEIKTIERRLQELQRVLEELQQRERELAED
jgi:predicted metalloprotease with PDZ domain